MECRQHPGHELPEIKEDLPACPECGNDPPPVLIGYGPCRVRECGAKYQLNGDLMVEEAPADVAEKPKAKKNGKAKE